MTDLLDPTGTRNQKAAAATGPPPRSLAVTAALAGVAAPVIVLAGCMTLAIIGWYASDAGGHGSTRDALRVGADGWLLAHAAHLQLATATAQVTLTAVPLGLTAVSLYTAHRLGRWAASSAVVEDGRTLGLAAVVLGVVYAVVALVVAVLAATPSVAPSPLWAFAGGLLVGLVGGGSGLVAGAAHVLGGRNRVPEALRAVAVGTVAATCVLFTAGVGLLAVALVADVGAAANVLARLHTDVPGGLLYTLLVAAVAPNAALLATSYLLGPGFAVGAGTLVSPGAVTLAPVPAFPLLAALPSPGTPAPWLGALVAIPFLAAMLGVALMVRRHPMMTYDAAVVRGTGAGLASGLLVTVLVTAAGGAVGPGRMTQVGAPLLETAVSATVAMGLGGLAAGVAATWWARRH